MLKKFLNLFCVYLILLIFNGLLANTAKPKLNVVTSFYPLAFLVEEITKKKMNVYNLSENQDAHNILLSPQQIIQINKADLIIYLSDVYFETWLKKPLEQINKKTKVVEVADTITLQPSNQSNKEEHHEEHSEEEHHEHSKEEHHEHSKEEHSEEGHHEHSKEEHSEEEHHEHSKEEHSEEGHHEHSKEEHSEEEHHEHSKEEHHEEHSEEEHHEEHSHFLDPHFWLDPVLMQGAVDLVAKEIINVDSANKSFYQKNAANLKQKFKKLNQDFEKAITKCNNRNVIVSHDFLGYLAKRYKFKVFPIAGISTLDEPSAKSLIDLKKVAKNKINYILAEPGSVTKFANVLATESNLTKLAFYPLSYNFKQEGFLKLMYKNIKNLKMALACS